MKLELNHLTPYADKALKGLFFDNKDILTEVDFVNSIVSSLNNGNVEIENFKPILRPLIDLTRNIELKGVKINPIKELAKLHIKWDESDYNLNIDYSYKRQFNLVLEWKNKYSNEIYYNDDLFIMTKRIGLNRYWVIDKFFEWHFDVFGLIEKGLAIDINTINN